MAGAPSGTEMHRDHVRDHGLDHVTKSAGPNVAGLAERVLRAIEEGAPESFELAAAMVREVLEDTLVRRALLLKRLLADRSPFALVRAVELARALRADPDDG